MDELPELPFEKVLSYLSLEDRLKSRAVSRSWYHKINSFNVKTLCYSQRPAGFIEGKHRLVSGAHAQNFISSTRFGCFFSTFRSTILSNLKHLRLCDLRLNKKMRKSFARILQSSGQLEELDIIRLDFHPNSYEDIELTLPMLTGIWLEGVRGIAKLTLNAPKLLKIKLANYGDLRLELVHAESVEWLMIDICAAMAVEKLKNLKILYALSLVNSTFLSSLEQLKEIHLDSATNSHIKKLFEQKQRHNRTCLKIYLSGLLLNGPDDPAIDSLFLNWEEFFRLLLENPSRLADQIPSPQWLDYTEIEHVAPELHVSILSRFSDCNAIRATKPVEDTDRFLNLLKNFDNIVRLEFYCDQPQDLFDRLPEHCAVQLLTIRIEPSDVRFLWRLKHLMNLTVCFSIDAGAIRKVLEEYEFLSIFSFKYLNKKVRIDIEYPKLLKVNVDYACKELPDLDAAIQFITEDSRPKSEHL